MVATKVDNCEVDEFTHYGLYICRLVRFGYWKIAHRKNARNVRDVGANQNQRLLSVKMAVQKENNVWTTMVNLNV